MYPTDVPPPSEPIRFVEMRGTKVDSPTHGGDPSPKSIRPGDNAGLVLLEQGQIATMRLPAGWSEGEPLTIRTSSLRQFNPGDKSDTALCFFYRGGPVSQLSAQSFHQVIQAPPHRLSDEEVKSIKEVLRDLAETKAFTMSTAQTANLGSKVVLIVEGTFDETLHQRYEIFVDADQSGALVQEVYFQAPKPDFDQYLEQVKAALESINWR